MSLFQSSPLPTIRSATLRFAVAGDAVTITDLVIDVSGDVRRGENIIRTDGLPYASPHGYLVAARWLDPRALEVAVVEG